MCVNHGHDLWKILHSERFMNLKSFKYKRRNPVTNRNATKSTDTECDKDAGGDSELWGTGGAGAGCWRAASPSYLYLQAQDSLTQKATHRHRNNPSTHPHVGLNISQAPADLPHILSRRSEKFPKAHPPPSALSPPSAVRPLCSASHTGSAARVSSGGASKLLQF